MISIAIFHISCTILIVVLLIMIYFMAGHGRKLVDEPFQLRRRSFLAFYSLMAIHTLSSCWIAKGPQVEVFATIPICTAYFALTSLMMLSSAYFGRNYYRNIFLWFLMMQYAIVLLIVNWIMRTMGKYTRIYAFRDIFMFGREEKIVFYSRIIWFSIIFSCILCMIIMVFESYLHFKHKKKEESLDEDQFQRKDEIVDLWIYCGLLTTMTGSFLFSSVWPHVLLNIAFTVLVARTYIVYRNFSIYTQDKLSGKLMYERMKDRLDQLVKQETNNPIYKSNTNIDEIADALKITRDDFSNYLYRELEVTFAAWVSEKKILHCADQLARTNRSVGEIAISTGYNDVSSMCKAFKKKFDMKPTEFRKKTQKMET
jgi:AraC-like DNA-binding protein